MNRTAVALALVSLLALTSGMYACGDDGASGPSSVSTETTVRRPANPAEPVIIERTLEIASSTRIEAVRFDATDGTFAGVERIELRARYVPERAAEEEVTTVIDVRPGADGLQPGTVLGVEPALDLGAAVSSDFDGDDIPNADDNCPRAVNATQSDADGDGIGDRCDDAPDDPNVGAAGELAGPTYATLEWRVSVGADFPNSGLTVATTLSGADLSLLP